MYNTYYKPFDDELRQIDIHSAPKAFTDTAFCGKSFYPTEKNS